MKRENPRNTFRTRCVIYTDVTEQFSPLSCTVPHPSLPSSLRCISAAHLFFVSPIPIYQFTTVPIGVFSFAGHTVFSWS